jgi:hypothetical protein
MHTAELRDGYNFTQLYTTESGAATGSELLETGLAEVSGAEDRG